MCSVSTESGSRLNNQLEERVGLVNADGTPMMVFSNNSLGTAGTRAGHRRLQRLELTEELPVSWLPARPPPTLHLLQAVHLLLHLYSTFYKHCIHFFSSTLLISGQQQRASPAAWARGWVGRDPGRRRRRTGHS